MGTIDLNGRDWAVGLQWLSPNSSGDGLEDQARSLCEELEGDFILPMQQSGKMRIGIGSRDASHNSGQRSLAAAVANAESGQWCGLFENNGQFILLASADGLPYPSSDILFDDKDEAINKMKVFLGLKNWKQRFAPEGFAIDNCIPKSLSDLDFDTTVGVLRPPKLPFSVKLQETVRSYGFYGLIGFTLVAGAAWGVNKYFAQQEAERLAAAQAAAQEKKRIEELEAERKRIASIVSEWEVIEPSTITMDRCLKKAANITTAISGWALQAWVCNDEHLKVEFERESYGKIAHLRAKLLKHGFTVKVTTGVSVESSYAFSLETTQKSPVLADRDMSQAQLIDSSTAWIGGLNLSSNGLETEDVGTSRQGNKVGKFSFSMTDVIAPRALGTALSTVEGLSITELRFDGSSYNLKGAVYYEN